MAGEILGDVFQALLVLFIAIGVIIMILYAEDIGKWWRKYGKIKNYR